MKKVRINELLSKQYMNRTPEELLCLRDEIALILFHARTDEQRRAFTEVLSTISFTIGTLTVLENM